MQAIIKAPSGCYPLEEARRIAAETGKHDPDWTYDVVDCRNGLGRIDIYDEDGELVFKGYLNV